jgi:hypothetical protein
MTVVLSLLVVCCACPAFADDGAAIKGDYMEMRTCDVYTGPCFANAEISLAGKQAIMAWSIEQGSQGDVDLAGLNVVLVVNASDTLTFGGNLNSRPEPIESVILADVRANDKQREALVSFVREHAGEVAGDVQRVDFVEIEMALNHVSMESSLAAGDQVRIASRKLMMGDCICTNEVLYYPPLANVENSAPAFTVEGSFQGAGLPVRFSNPSTRSTYLATFAY